ncbi:cytochrome b/b6 domain-containing protein [Rhodobacter ferrooxidans]|uniref:YceI family protein n=1 Tax=Rhodobacter ferrooxidans TaxID=371731 RepID=C8RYW4_9RHOB|nr:cytochrome b/b6 domain-containing protein [Rhodobacter sp. SW2]EEW25921.1 YceI family protein [Rhodobacter sp. SW2]
MRNTTRSYGKAARSLHWLTALLILTAIPLGLYANALPVDGAEAAAAKAAVFSLHKTLGIATFFVALLRIAYMLTETRPAPLHPERRLETFAAEATHWLLYLSLLAVPLSGWVHHAATSGFAPILWPLGQDLPLVPKSESLAAAASALHWVFTKLMAAAILLHVAGALKHALIDRDSTLARMLRGTPAGQTHASRATKPLLTALAVYILGAGLAVALIPPAPTAQAPQTATSGNWQITSGTLSFSVSRLGTAVEGSFATWSAEITFDPEAATGNHVTARIDTSSLTLGAVTDQAKGPEFLNAALHPTAIFTAEITADGTAYLATGTLSLHGISQPLTLPFTLQITGDTAQMQGTATLDRRAFQIGTAYPDEATVGFPVTVSIALTATRR